MTQAIRDSFHDLERHRQLLEINVEKLKKSLEHWQTWEAEYEGLREDIATAGPALSREKLVSICGRYDGRLVTPPEVEDILGVKVARSVDQVNNVLDRRIDYVSQNIKTLEQQLNMAENKVARASIISTPDVRNEEGLPLMEIIEELDEEGNVLAGRTEPQEKAPGQLLELLEKAGVKELPKAEDEQPVKEPVTDSRLKFEAAQESRVEEGELYSISMTEANKSVRFTDEVRFDTRRQNMRISKQVEDVENLYKEQKISARDRPNVPAGESQEDAALRKEMLQYSMSEVGAVVAELDLEEGSDFSDDDEDSQDYEGMSSSGDEEDEYGRSTKKVVDEELHSKMIELEQKLGARMMRNVGPNLHHVQKAVDEIGDVTIPPTDNREPSPSAESGQAKKKAVRFANDLDISYTPQPPEPQNSQVKYFSKSPVGDIFEHNAPASEQATIIPLQRVSRFKNARVLEAPPKEPAANESGIPSSSESFSTTNSSVLSPGRINNSKSLSGKTIADQIIERQAPTTIPSGPDEFNPALLRQEAMTEYHRSRHRMIQKQDGFLKDLEGEMGIIPFSEEEGGPKKLSRFRTERLGKF